MIWGGREAAGSGGRVTPIYHITHLDNLPNIIRAECLWSDAQRIRRKLACTNIGHKHIKERRLKRLVQAAAGGKLGEYVPFNFCPRSVMLCTISHGHKNYSGGQERIVHLVTSVERAVQSGRACAFSDRHAELAYAVISDDLDQLEAMVEEILADAEHKPTVAVERGWYY